MPNIDYRVVARRFMAAFLGAATALLTGCGGGGPEAAPKAVSAQPAVDTVSLVSDTLVPAAPVVEQVRAIPEGLAARSTPQRLQQRIGANLTTVRSYSRTHEFVDLVMAADGFGAVKEFSGITAAIGSDGWPVQDFSITLWSSQRGTTGLGGTYKVVFQGQGDIQLLNGSGASISGKTFHADVNKTTYDLQFPEGGDQLGLSIYHKKDSSGAVIDRVRNVQVIRPGYDWKSPPMFTREFLAQLSRFSTLRFMDWLETNVDVTSSQTGPEGEWARRPTPINKRVANGRNVPRGQPWERVIELSNVTGTDVWINIPPKANEAYVENLARFLKTGLLYGQNIYVEYGNEMWNVQFKQTLALWDEALAEVAANTAAGRRISSGLFVGTDASGRVWTYDDHKYDMGARLYADRLARFSDIFRREFGDAAMMSRVRPVLAWQIVMPASTEKLLKFVAGQFPQKPNHYFYAISGAPYYAMTNADHAEARTLRQTAVNLNSSITQQNLQNGTNLPLVNLDAPEYTLSVQRILDSFAQTIANTREIQRYESNYFLAQRYGLKWIAYEGGPDTFGIESDKNKALASRQERMYTLCQDHLNNWAKAGGGLFMWFNAGAGVWTGAFGSWPLAEQISETNNPKLRCMDWAWQTEAPEVVAGRHVAPTTIGGGSIIRIGASMNELYSESAADKSWYAADLVRSYAVGATANQCFRLTFSVSNTSFSTALSALPFEISLNEQVILLNPEASVPPNTTRAVDLGKVCLPKGINYLTLRSTSSRSFTLNSITWANWVD